MDVGRAHGDAQGQGPAEERTGWHSWIGLVFVVVGAGVRLLDLRE